MVSITLNCVILYLGLALWNQTVTSSIKYLVWRYISLQNKCVFFHSSCLPLRTLNNFQWYILPGKKNFSLDHNGIDP